MYVSGIMTWLAMGIAGGLEGLVVDWVVPDWLVAGGTYG